MKRKILVGSSLAIIVVALLMSGSRCSPPMTTPTPIINRPASSSSPTITPSPTITTPTSSPSPTTTPFPTITTPASSPSSTITPTSPLVAPPVFYNLEITIDPAGAGLVRLKNVKEGAVTIYPRNLRGVADSDSWPSGTAVELTAVSAPDWEFDCWGRYEPDYPDPIPTSYDNTITITVDENMSIAASFICRG